MRTAKTLIRLGGCPGWSESSLSAHSLCWFCHVGTHACKAQRFTEPTRFTDFLARCFVLAFSRWCFCFSVFIIVVCWSPFLFVFDIWLVLLRISCCCWLCLRHLTGFVEDILLLLAVSSTFGWFCWGYPAAAGCVFDICLVSLRISCCCWLCLRHLFGFVEDILLLVVVSSTFVWFCWGYPAAAGCVFDICLVLLRISCCCCCWLCLRHLFAFVEDILLLLAVSPTFVWFCWGYPAAAGCVFDICLILLRISCCCCWLCLRHLFGFVEDILLLLAVSSTFVWFCWGYPAAAGCVFDICLVSLRISCRCWLCLRQLIGFVEDILLLLAVASTFDWFCWGYPAAAGCVFNIWLVLLRISYRCWLWLRQLFGFVEDILLLLVVSSTFDWFCWGYPTAAGCVFNIWLVSLRISCRWWLCLWHLIGFVEDILPLLAMSSTIVWFCWGYPAAAGCCFDICLVSLRISRCCWLCLRHLFVFFEDILLLLAVSSTFDWFRWGYPAAAGYVFDIWLVFVEDILPLLAVLTIVWFCWGYPAAAGCFFDICLVLSRISCCCWLCLRHLFGFVEDILLLLAVSSTFVWFCWGCPAAARCVHDICLVLLRKSCCCWLCLRHFFFFFFFFEGILLLLAVSSTFFFFFGFVEDILLLLAVSSTLIWFCWGYPAAVGCVFDIYLVLLRISCCCWLCLRHLFGFVEDILPLLAVSSTFDWFCWGYPAAAGYVFDNCLVLLRISCCCWLLLRHLTGFVEDILLLLAASSTFDWFCWGYPAAAGYVFDNCLVFVEDILLLLVVSSTFDLFYWGYPAAAGCVFNIWLVSLRISCRCWLCLRHLIGFVEDILPLLAMSSTIVWFCWGYPAAAGCCFDICLVSLRISRCCWLCLWHLFFFEDILLLLAVSSTFDWFRWGYPAAAGYVFDIWLVFVEDILPLLAVSIIVWFCWGYPAAAGCFFDICLVLSRISCCCWLCLRHLFGFVEDILLLLAVSSTFVWFCWGCPAAARCVLDICLVLLRISCCCWLCLRHFFFFFFEDILLLLVVSSTFFFFLVLLRISCCCWLCLRHLFDFVEDILLLLAVSSTFIWFCWGYPAAVGSVFDICLVLLRISCCCWLCLRHLIGFVEDILLLLAPSSTFDWFRWGYPATAGCVFDNCLVLLRISCCCSLLLRHLFDFVEDIPLLLAVSSTFDWFRWGYPAAAGCVFDIWLFFVEDILPLLAVSSTIVWFCWVYPAAAGCVFDICLVLLRISWCWLCLRHLFGFVEDILPLLAVSSTFDWFCWGYPATAGCVFDNCLVLLRIPRCCWLCLRHLFGFVEDILMLAVSSTFVWFCWGYPAAAGCVFDNCLVLLRISCCCSLLLRHLFDFVEDIPLLLAVSSTFDWFRWGYPAAAGCVFDNCLVLLRIPRCCWLCLRHLFAFVEDILLLLAVSSTFVWFCWGCPAAARCVLDICLVLLRISCCCRLCLRHSFFFFFFEDILLLLVVSSRWIVWICWSNQLLVVSSTFVWFCWGYPAAAGCGYPAAAGCVFDIWLILLKISCCCWLCLRYLFGFVEDFLLLLVLSSTFVWFCSGYPAAAGCVFDIWLVLLRISCCCWLCLRQLFGFVVDILLLLVVSSTFVWFCWGYPAAGCVFVICLVLLRISCCCWLCLRHLFGFVEDILLLVLSSTFVWFCWGYPAAAGCVFDICLVLLKISCCCWLCLRHFLFGFV